MIKAVIFDMDGVLIDAREWHYQALNKALRLFGLEINLYDHLMTFDGLPTKEKLKILSLDKGLPVALHSFVAEMKQQYTMEIVHSLCKPKFHHEYALSKLKNDGYKMAVCSNSIRHTIEVMMQKAALESYFEFYISNEDVSKSKPDPQMYQLAINKLNLTPKECLIVEDNENGIKAAKASGAYIMEVQSVYEVNYENITKHIVKFTQG